MRWFFVCGPTRIRTSNCGFGDRYYTIVTIGPYITISVTYTKICIFVFKQYVIFVEYEFDSIATSNDMKELADESIA